MKALEPLLADRITDPDEETLPEAVRLAINRERHRLVEDRRVGVEYLRDIDRQTRELQADRKETRRRLDDLDRAIEALNAHLLQYGIEPD